MKLKEWPSEATVKTLKLAGKVLDEEISGITCYMRRMLGQPDAGHMLLEVSGAALGELLERLIGPHDSNAQLALLPEPQLPHYPWPAGVDIVWLEKGWVLRSFTGNPTYRIAKACYGYVEKGYSKVEPHACMLRLPRGGFDIIH